MRRLTLFLSCLALVLCHAAFAGDTDKEKAPPADAPSPVDEGEVDLSMHPDPATMAKAFDGWWTAQKTAGATTGTISFTDPEAKTDLYLTLVKWEKDIFVVQGQPGYCRTGSFQPLGGEEGQLYRVDVWLNPGGTPGGWAASRFEIQGAPTKTGQKWSTTARKSTLTTYKHWPLE